MRTIFIFLAFTLLYSCDSPQKAYVEPEIKVLVLGNSIVGHPPAPDLGWYGNGWGMAATAPNKDFISQLKHTVTGKSVAGWESTFELPEVSSERFDYIIVRLGENVTQDRLSDFATALPPLVNLYRSADTKIIVTGVCWWNQGKDEVLEEFALANGYTYISLQDMWGTVHQATEYENDAVAIHPNDLGHKYIADKINEHL